MTFEEAVRSVVAAIPPGEVLSYGEVAEEAGHPGAARAVGNLLRRATGLPWWRVVAADGRLAPHLASRQAALLRAEGVVVRDGVVVPSTAHRCDTGRDRPRRHP